MIIKMILFIDVNNLNVWAMCENLPYDEYKVITNPNLEDI